MSAFPPIAELVPHAGTMLLLDRVVTAEDDFVRSEAVIAADGIFFQPGRGAPAYIGFELMAQTISAYDGLRRRRDGRPPAIGFLLGCRRYAAVRPYFAAGERLVIEARSLLGEEGMASFECRICSTDETELASAVINVYRPRDPEAFLAGSVLGGGS